MIAITKKFKTGMMLLAGAMAFLSSCNKGLEDITGNTKTPTGLAMGETLATIPTDSLYYRIILRSGTTLAPLNTGVNQYTLFATDNNGVKVFANAVGGVPLSSPNSTFSTFINTSVSAATAANIINYNTVPQAFPTTAFVHAFPNLELPTNLQVDPTNPFARMRLYVSKNPSTGIYYVNNLPLSGMDVPVSNGILHHTPVLLTPPQRMIWERINTDADLTIFKAALLRADSGYTPATAGSLIGGLQNFGANFTVFAPTNAAMKAFISALTGGLIPIGAPDANFINFLASPLIMTRDVKGVAVYHLLGNRPWVGAPVAGIRAFSVNIPTTPTNVLTFLNNPGPGVNHPGVTVMAAFTGPSATSFTVKGLANATASNVLINPTPDALPSYNTTPPAAPIVYTGTSDQFYINGILHKIDQVLRPL
jgi:hypothetical protein